MREGVSIPERDKFGAFPPSALIPALYGRRSGIPDSSAGLGPIMSEPDARAFAESVKKCDFHYFSEMGGKAPKITKMSKMANFW